MARRFSDGIVQQAASFTEEGVNRFLGGWNMSRILICASLFVAAACSTPHPVELIKIVPQESITHQEPDLEAPMEERVYTWTPSSKQALQSPVQAITTFIAPNSWSEEATIRLDGERLLVRHRPGVHAQIKELLKSLQQDPGAIATFDISILRVDRELLSGFQAFRATEGSGAYAVVNRSDFDARIQREQGVFERHPVLTCFMGQSGQWTTTRERAYISGIEVLDDARLDPTIDLARSGLAFELMAIPQGDAGTRVHVRLAVHEIESMTPIELGGGRYVFQLPKLASRRLHTTVSLTDETCAVILNHYPGNTDSLMMTVVRCDRTVIN